MTYEYVCAACGHEWEAEQRISESPLTDCPSCGKPKARRQISAGAGFILKGSGWYSDGYASPKTASAPEKKTESATDSPAKPSEPATKTETKSASDGKAAA